MNRNLRDLYDPPILAFNRSIRSRLDPGKPVIDLNQAVPDYPPPDCITAVLRRALKEGGYHVYTEDEGLPELRGEIVKELHRLYGNELDTDFICVTAGANNAFFSALAVAAGSGDEIILLSPWYFNHHMAARILGIGVREVHLDPEDGFALHMGRIRAAVTHRTRAVVLVNPSNPTGRSYRQEDVEALHRLCRELGLLLISDEVYTCFHDDYPRPASPLRLPGGLDHAIAIHSFSKSYALTGLRTGFIAAHPDFIRQYLKVHDTATICAPRLGQIAALAGLREGRSWLEERIADMRRRSLVFEERFREKHLPFRLLSRGAFFVWLRHESALTGAEVCMRLAENRNLILLPGRFFGSGREKAVRIALGNLDEARVPWVLDQLSAPL
jgi:aspartate/methionine/tyrosine aminotransferase